jgi:hypothetical protein
VQFLTIIESPLFSKYWPDYWSADEHGEFMAYLASHPEGGAVENIPAHILRELAKELGYVDE